MAAYAVLDDVLARVGRLGRAFSIAGQRPNQADITNFLDELSTEVDEAIRSRGFDPAGIDANAKKSLLDLVAYGAAARALRALGDRSPEVLQVLVEADAVWGAAMGDGTSAGSIFDGTHPLFTALDAGAAGGGAVVSASSFWESESNYGRYESAIAEYWALRGTNIGPSTSKGQKL